MNVNVRVYVYLICNSTIWVGKFGMSNVKIILLLDTCMEEEFSSTAKFSKTIQLITTINLKTRK